VHISLDHEKEMRKNGGCMWDCNRFLLENSCSTGIIRESAGNYFVFHVWRNGLKIFFVEKYPVRGT
jgi:hypothetical protein